MAKKFKKWLTLNPFDSILETMRKQTHFNTQKGNIMATDKMFTVAGTSKLNGEVKVRFANDVMRIKVLAKHGHEDINLIELPNAMTKLEAVQFLKGLDEFTSAADQAAIADYLDGRTEKAPKAEKTVKTAPKKAAPKKAAVKAPKVDTSEMEDAPF